MQQTIGPTRNCLRFLTVGQEKQRYTQRTKFIKNTRQNKNHSDERSRLSQKGVLTCVFVKEREK